jgi:hypothetical protein
MTLFVLDDDYSVITDRNLHHRKNINDLPSCGRWRRELVMFFRVNFLHRAEE